ncbi:MAG: hypothetical protein Q4C54_03260 [Clostridia bacterium]|nr:hypothetical protein [Clostridia bacterium]
MARISRQAMCEAMRPFVGSAICDNTDFCTRLTDVLMNYAPYRDTLEDVLRQLESAIFNSLYELLGEGMKLRLDDGTVCRIRLSQLPQLADEALCVMFEGMEPYSRSYTIIKDYSLHAMSLSAMRILYTKFAGMQTEEEKRYLENVIRENFPEERYRSWLRPSL